MQVMIAAAVYLTLASACSTAERQDLMSAIEAKLVMPAGAASIEAYSRNYAFRPDGKVVAIYVIPRLADTREDPEDGCEVLLEDFESRPCSDDEIAELRQQHAAIAAQLGTVGQSRWFDDYLELPAISDGGCDVLDILFNPNSGQIEHIACNGQA